MAKYIVILIILMFSSIVFSLGIIGYSMHDIAKTLDKMHQFELQYAFDGD